MNRRELIKLLPATLVFNEIINTENTNYENINPELEDQGKSIIVAPRPPLGWNSFDAYDCRINEQEFRAVVDWMADNLKEVGFEYVVIDYIWFNDNPGNWKNPNRRHGHPDLQLNEDGSPKDKLIMDKFGRLLPSEKRFPSAANNKGFKPLADYVHSKGLKFGIHIMRGIPRQAYYENTAVKGTKYFAKDIAEPFDNCNWCNNMFGVDASKPGAQAYYDSLFELYAKWDVDFIKADDTMYPPYHKGEIEILNKAIQKCGRPMVLSLSCGEAPLAQANHLKQNANMWRVSADFWDKWPALLHSFDLLNSWSSHTRANRWPDGDMLPIGYLSMDNRPHGPERMSLFTVDEHYTLMTLFCIARSPLIWGGDPFKTPKEIVDTFLKNKNLIYVNQYSTDNRQVFHDKNSVAWIAKDTKSNTRYLALFNTGEEKKKVTFNLELEHLRGDYKIKDLWTNEELGTFKGTFATEINAHGGKLYSLTKFTT